MPLGRGRSWLRLPTRRNLEKWFTLSESMPSIAFDGVSLTSSVLVFRLGVHRNGSLAHLAMLSIVFRVLRAVQPVAHEQRIWAAATRQKMKIGAIQ